MLSAFGTKEQMRSAFTHHKVVDFLSKEEFSQERFLQSIQLAFSRDLNINLELDIFFQVGSNSEQVILNLDVDEERITGDSPRRSLIAAELEDLLCRLFYQADGILVKSLTPGLSGTAVLRVQTFFNNKGIGREVIVKFGDVQRIQAEYRNFKDHVEPFIGDGRNTSVLAVRRTTHLGGIIYTLLGANNGQFVNFAEFYAHNDVPRIRNAIVQLFTETCGTWYANRKNLQLLDLTTDYQRFFGYTLEQLEQARFKLRSVRGKKRLLFSALNAERTFTNPFLVMIKSSLPCQSYTCVTHGDFNPHNLLVDNTGYIWLIDFQGTGLSHIFRDVTMLDSVIRFQLLSEGEASLEERLLMEEALLENVQHFSQVERLMDNFSTKNQALAKAYAVVAHLRCLAYRLVAQNEFNNINEYYIALFYTALNTLRFFSLSAGQREHALLCASLLADRLGLSE